MIPIRALMVGNSDTLLAAAYAQNLLRHPGTIAGFELSRLPSFVPDLALYVAAAALLPWRAAAYAYAVVSYVAFVFLGGAVVGRMAGRSGARGAAVFLSTSAIALMLEMDRDESAGALFYVFVPINHAGSFALSLAGLLLARRAVDHPSARLLAALAGLATAGMLSDKLFLGSCLAPLAAGVIVLGWREEALRIRRCGAVCGAVALGCLAGMVLDRVLFGTLLVRQPDLVIDVAAQLRRAGDMVGDPSLLTSVGLASVAVLLPVLWRRRGREGAFWWTVAAVTVLGFMALLPLLYVDTSAARYLQPVRWWAVLVLAATALRSAPRAAPWALGALAPVTMVVMLSRGHEMLLPSAVFASRPAGARCLQQLQQTGAVHAGIAQYWTARVTEAALDWTLPIEQVINGGEIFVWGNNPYYYTHDKADPSAPARFDFILMRDLDPGAIAARFGAPGRIVPCPGGDVWLYHDPGGIGRWLGGIDLAGQRGGILSDSACFGPRDFSTRAGPLSPQGLTVPETAPAHDFGTYGPYVRLGPGEWRFRLTYRLDAADTRPRDWDIAIDTGHTILKSGTLPAGSTPRTETIDLTTKRDTNPLELRTFLQPGDHFQLFALAIGRVQDAPPACAFPTSPVSAKSL